MYGFKDFITGQRLIDLKDPYIIINVNISPAIYEYIQSLRDIKFEDGNYHTYCGDIKEVINNFINYWSEVVNECVKEVDTLLHTVDRLGFIALIKNSAVVQANKQKIYLNAYGLPENDEEQKTLNEINELYIKHLEGLRELEKSVTQIETNEQFLKFLKDHLDLSIKKKNEAFELAHTFIANTLAKCSYKIKASFEEIWLRMKNNLKKLNEQRMDKLRILMDELYEANKDRLLVSRQERHRISDTAEVDYEISRIRDKIERHQQDHPFVHLEGEVAYWEKKAKEYQHLDNIITKIKRELEHVTEYLERYNEMSTTEYPGAKKTCWNNIGENYRRRKEILEKNFMDACKAIMTFFSIRGQNRIFYKDNLGTYAIDDYGHQMYFYDYGQTIYNNTCNNELVVIPQTDKYYYDDLGRYILNEDGEKVHQIAPCGSSYKLNEDDLLEKITKDCGHSEFPNPDCGLTIKDPNVFEMLPAAEPVNIKQTLEPEVVKYLWDSLAYVLPDALYDTGNKKTNNPIYYLANRLIYHKYHKNSTQQLEEKKKEAEKYKADLLQKRKDKAIAAAKQYKAKLVQPRKPEELDDTDARQVLAAHAATEHLKNQLTYYEYY